MKLIALFECEDYEVPNLVGLYADLAEAKAAAIVLAAKDDYWGSDDFAYREVVVGADAVGDAVLDYVGLHL
jgi:hypothetical protein